MGSSTQTSTQQQHSETQPWAPAIPGLQKVIGDATNLYSTGVGDGVYSGPRVAQLNGDSLTGLQMARDQAASDNSGPIGVSWLQNLLGANGISGTTAQGLGMLSGVSGITAPGSVLSGAGLDGNGLTAGQNAGLGLLSGVQGISGQLGLDGNGLSDGTNGALGTLAGVKGVDTSKLSALADSMGSAANPVNQTASGFMSGARDITTEPALQSLFARALAPSSAEQNLSGVAAGANLDPTANPIFQKLAKTSSDNAANAAKEAMAASGRYGSGAFSGAVAKAVNDTQSALYANQYNTERAAQASAAGQIDSARQAGTQLGAGIQGQIGSVQQTNNSQRLAGAGLAQSQDAARAGVLGQVLGGDQFNSSLDLSKAQGLLSTMLQGTQNNIATKEFDANLGMQKAQAALGTYGQGASARLSGAGTDAANDLATQQANTSLGVNKAQGYIGAGQSGVSSAISGAGQLPSLDALRYTPSQVQSNIGSVLQGQDQNNIDAAMEYYQQLQQQPWSYLGQYAGLMGGMAGLGGTTDSYGKTTQKTNPGMLNSILGGASSIAGMGANLGKAVPFLSFLGL